MQKHLIWTSECDFEDWEADLQEEHPDYDDDQLRDLMYRTNAEYLADERVNLNIPLGQIILVVADIGSWNGRYPGYREITSGNIRDCLYPGRDDLDNTWYVDEHGDLRCEAVHHDSANYLLYRVWKPSVSDVQADLLKSKIVNGTFTRADITRYTSRLGDYIGEVYGWKPFPGRKPNASK